MSSPLTTSTSSAHSPAPISHSQVAPEGISSASSPAALAAAVGDVSLPRRFRPTRDVVDESFDSLTDDEEDGRGLLRMRQLLTSNASVAPAALLRNNARRRLRLPPWCRACLRDVCPRLLVGLLGLSVFLTLGLSIKANTCWTVRDELEMLSRFNQVTLLDTESPLPLAHAFSHNDYQRTLPMAEALAAGFCAMEADVFVLDNKELVLGHDNAGPRSLKEVYLDPLEALVRKNPQGTLYRRAVSLGVCLQFTLLIDFKSDNKLDVLNALEDLLEVANKRLLPDGRYLFETYDADGSVRQAEGAASALPSPLRIVVSGIPSQEAAVAARLMERGVHRSKMDIESVSADPRVSAQTGMISKIWTASWPAAATDALEAELRAWTTEAKRRGYQTRFWKTPEDAKLWSLLLRNGVDLINSDLVYSLHAYLAGRSVE